jgi:hypothetical protein
MLTENKVLSFIKSNMGFPRVAIELGDTEIMDNIKTYVLTEFSKWQPLIKSTFLAVQEGVQTNKYKIMDDEKREILDLVDYVPGVSEGLLYGRPIQSRLRIISPLSVDIIATQHLAYEMAKQYSNSYYKLTFLPPDTIEIIPDPLTVNNTLIYACKHRIEDIPFDFENNFLRLSLGYTKIIIGTIRTKYNGLETPFGTIGLDGSEQLSKGEEMWNSEIDKLSKIIPAQEMLYVE